MAIDALVDQVKSVLDVLKDADYTNLVQSGAPAQPWNGFTSQEVSSFIENTFSVLSVAVDKGLLADMSFNQLNALVGSLNNFNTQFNTARNIATNQISNQHHNPLNQLQAVDNNLRTSGLYSIVKLDPDLEKKAELIDSQILLSREASVEIESLANQVKQLLDPAVASALSNTFDIRRKNVANQKWFWFVVFVVSIGLSTWVTTSIVSSIESSNPKGGEYVAQVELGPINSNFAQSSTNPKASPSNSNGDSDNIASNSSLILFLRMLLLIPAYFSVGFSVRQILRERNFEENYAHKSSVAQTLPSYAELVTSSAVKDEIMSSATKVVFSPPFPVKTPKSPKKGIDTEEFKEFVELMKSMKNTLSE